MGHLSYQILKRMFNIILKNVLYVWGLNTLFLILLPVCFGLDFDKSICTLPIEIQSADEEELGLLTSRS